MPEFLANTPQTSLGTAALVIFVIFAAFVLLRGITRMLLGAAVLCGSVWVGFLVWQKAPAWAIEWTGQPVAWISNGLPVAAFAATFLIARLVIGFFLKPFRPQEGAKGNFVVKLLFAIIPTALVWLTGATLVHHAGAIAELARSAEGGGKGAGPGFSGRAAELKEAIAGIIPADWLARLDPLADAEHLSLARLIAAQPASGLKPVIDPETGKPYPRAIIVDQPELQDLASDGRFGTMVRHPLFQKALEDPKIRQALKDHPTAKP